MHTPKRFSTQSSFLVRYSLALMTAALAKPMILEALQRMANDWDQRQMTRVQIYVLKQIILEACDILAQKELEETQS